MLNSVWIQFYISYSNFEIGTHPNFSNIWMWGYVHCWHTDWKSKWTTEKYIVVLENWNAPIDFIRSMDLVIYLWFSKINYFLFSFRCCSITFPPCLWINHQQCLAFDWISRWNLCFFIWNDYKHRKELKIKCLHRLTLKYGITNLAEPIDLESKMYQSSDQPKH